MRLSRRSQRLLGVGVGVTLAFIYIPLIVIAIYAFNGGSDPQAGRPPELTPIGSAKAIDDHGRPRRALGLGQGRAVATAIALVLGTLASFAVARYRFFGRETISFLVILPIALPGIVTGVALSNTFTQVFGVDLSLLTVIVGHATFCIVVVYNNVIARLRRVSELIEEASADLGARHLADLPAHDVAQHADRARRGWAARLRALLRRDHRHHVHDRSRRGDAADLDLQQPLPAATSSTIVNVMAVV